MSQYQACRTSCRASETIEITWTLY